MNTRDLYLGGCIVIASIVIGFGLDVIAAAIQGLQK